LSLLAHLELERLQIVDSPSILRLELNLTDECATNVIYSKWTRGLVFILVVGFKIGCGKLTLL
jgi:hypothetical protein